MRSESGRTVSIPLWILTHPTLKDSAKVFWAILKADYADQRTSNPSRAELAADLNLSIASVDRHYKALQDAGAIKLVSNTGARKDQRGPCEYELIETLESSKRATQVASELRPSQRVISLVQVEPPRRYVNKTARGSRVSVVSTISYVRFTEFWKLYPKKRNKVETKRWWLKHNVEEDSALFGTIMAGVRRWIEVWRAEDTLLRYIPYPMTFLKREQYQDDVEPPVPTMTKQTVGMVSASHRFLQRHGGGHK